MTITKADLNPIKTALRIAMHRGLFFGSSTPQDEIAAIGAEMMQIQDAYNSLLILEAKCD